MRAKRLMAIGAGLVLGVGSACSLLTTLDAPRAGALADATSGDDVNVEPFPDGGPVAYDAADAAGEDVCSPDATLPIYGANYVDQSFPLATTALTMVEGQVIPSYIELKNIGNAPWTSYTRLATTQPEFRVSPFADSTWLSPEQPAAVKGTVAPGGTFKFQFDLQAPEIPDTYYEFYGLVDESPWHCSSPDPDAPDIWFGDPGQGGPANDDIEVQINVIAPQYRAKLVSQTFADAGVTAVLGAVVSGSFHLSNTGTQSWISGTTKLAPIPRDVASPFADPSWLSTTRISTVASNVAPGGSGDFAVTLDANQTGTFDVEFGLVEEGVTWFADPTLGGGPPDGYLRVHLVVEASD
ncbi:MAG: hypothetical protein ACLQVI_07120 [Polyangiaceae bacterium]